MKHLKKIITSVVASIALFVFLILDKKNPIGLFDRVISSNKSSIFILILIVVMVFIFLLSFIYMIITIITKNTIKQEKAASILDTMNIIPITISIFLLFDSLLFSPVVVNGSSMEKTLYSGDYLIINHIKNEYEIGDIVIINNPKDVLIIKRVVAKEGSTLTVTNSGTVIVDGEIIENRAVSSFPYDNYTLKSGEYYCLGDNRGNSLDSRAYGVFYKDDIYGKVALRLNPWTTDFSINEE